MQWLNVLSPKHRHLHIVKILVKVQIQEFYRLGK